MHTRFVHLNMILVAVVWQALRIVPLCTAPRLGVSALRTVVAPNERLWSPPYAKAHSEHATGQSHKWVDTQTALMDEPMKERMKE